MVIVLNMFILFCILLISPLNPLNQLNPHHIIKLDHKQSVVKSPEQGLRGLGGGYSRPSTTHYYPPPRPCFPTSFQTGPAVAEPAQLAG